MPAYYEFDGLMFNVFVGNETKPAWVTRTGPAARMWIEKNGFELRQRTKEAIDHLNGYMRDGVPLF